MRALLFACALLMGAPLIATTQSLDSEGNAAEPTVARKWECRESSRDSGRVLITLWHSTEATPGKTGYGHLKYAGVSFPAAFRLDGLLLRWDWDLEEDGSAEHSFVIRPNGTAYAYDFTGAEPDEEVWSSGTYTCKAAGEEEVPMDALSEWAEWYLNPFFRK